MSDPVIKVLSLTKSYAEFLAVDNISFEMQRGEIFGLLGPNGAGKTTTLECLEGLRLPDKGVSGSWVLTLSEIGGCGIFS